MIFLKFLKSPLGRYITNIVILLLSLYGIYWWGGHVVQKKWDAENERIAAIEKEKKKESNEVTVKTVIKYRDRIKVVKEKGEEVIKYVDRYITKENDAKCVINRGAIRMYDDTLKNRVPTSTGGTNDGTNTNSGTGNTASK